MTGFFELLVQVSERRQHLVIIHLIHDWSADYKEWWRFRLGCIDKCTVQDNSTNWRFIQGSVLFILFLPINYDNLTHSDYISIDGRCFNWQGEIYSINSLTPINCEQWTQSRWINKHLCNSKKLWTKSNWINKQQTITFKMIKKVMFILLSFSCYVNAVWCIDIIKFREVIEN